MLSGLLTLICSLPHFLFRLICSVFRFLWRLLSRAQAQASIICQYTDSAVQCRRVNIYGTFAQDFGRTRQCLLLRLHTFSESLSPPLPLQVCINIVLYGAILSQFRTPKHIWYCMAHRCNTLHRVLHKHAKCVTTNTIWDSLAMW